MIEALIAPGRRGSRVLHGFFLSLALAAALPAPGCGKKSAPPPQKKKEKPAAAVVALEGVPFWVRRPGELAFTRTLKTRRIEADTTVKTGPNWLALNVLQSIQVQLSPGTELLVVGRKKRGKEEAAVLGLQSGQVRVNAVFSDIPVFLETPVGTAHGGKCHFTAAITTDEEGAFRLEVQALTKGIVLENPSGSVALPIEGRALAGETGPPRLLPRPARR